MKRSTGIWLAIAAVLLIAGGALFTTQFAKSGWDFSALNRNEYEEKTVPIAGTFGSITIKAQTEDITVAPSEDGTCSVVLFEAEKIRHKVEVENGTLKIETKDDRSWTDLLSFFYSKKTPITLYLPKQEYASLSIEATTGDITLDLPKEISFKNIAIAASTGDIFCGTSAKEALSIALSTGDITLENTSAGNTCLALTTGKVNVSSCSCRDLTVSQTTGRTNLSDITCDSLCSTASTGRIKLENVYADRKISIERTTGDITLLGCDASELFLKTTTGDVEGSLRTEKTFFTETDTGRVDVPMTLSNFTCEVHTTTGNITFTIER